jgi:hypothetical protein
MTAVAATIQALIAREATGHRYLVDVSESEPLASFQFVNVGGWTYMVKPGHRGFSGKVVDVSGAVMEPSRSCWARIIRGAR